MRFFTLVSLLLTFGLDASGKEFFVLQGIDKTHPDDVLQSPGLDGFRSASPGKNSTTRVSPGLMSRSAAATSWTSICSCASWQVPTPRPTYPASHILITCQPIPSALWNCGGSPFPGTQPCTHIGKIGNQPGQPIRRQPAHRSRPCAQLRQLVGAPHAGGSDFTRRLFVAQPGRIVGRHGGAFGRGLSSRNRFAQLCHANTGAIASDDAQWLIDELANLAAGRAGYQANDLAADVDLERNKYQTLIEQHELGRHVGFQMVSSSNQPRFGGDFLEAVDTAFQAGAQWLEIYAADIGKIPPPGDYNLNGTVDAADYVVWRATVGQTGSGLVADGDANNRIDAADYRLWRANFGVISENDVLAIASVPEPTNQILLLGMLGIFFIRPASLATRRHVAHLPGLGFVVLIIEPSELVLH